MMKDKYERTLNRFESYYPSLYERIIDWWASGRMAITVKLDDGTLFEYDPMDESLRQVVDQSDEDETVIRKAFGNNIQKMLPFSGMNQGELADKVGVSRVMMSKYIRGKSVPNVIIARKIAWALDCDINELFDDTYMC
jgi:DNA-binding XRE family transcriptional regulator